MEQLWRLATAIFIIAVSLGLFVVGWILSGGDFHDYFTACLLYVVLGGIAWGTCRGISAIINHTPKEEK
ncbi:MAG: hypothetical protein Q4F17_05680 [Eubacteriales bacterium]|nr:hypothetical protein [Eubacteriales bacterium]